MKKAEIVDDPMEDDIDCDDIKVDCADIETESVDNKAASVDNRIDGDVDKKGAGEKYPCPYCDKKYESWLGLSYHKKQKHSWGVFRSGICLN